MKNIIIHQLLELGFPYMTSGTLAYLSPAIGPCNGYFLYKVVRIRFGLIPSSKIDHDPSLDIHVKMT